MPTPGSSFCLVCLDCLVCPSVSFCLVKYVQHHRSFHTIDCTTEASSNPSSPSPPRSLLRPPPPSLYDSFQEVEWLSRARQISTFSPQGPSIFNAAKASRPSTAATIIENESRRLDNMYIAGQR